MILTFFETHMVMYRSKPLSWQGVIGFMLMSWMVVLFLISQLDLLLSMH